MKLRGRASTVLAASLACVAACSPSNDTPTAEGRGVRPPPVSAGTASSEGFPVDAWNTPGAFVARWGVGRIDDVIAGDKSWPHLTTPGDGSIELVAPSLPLETPLDLSNRSLRVRVRVVDPAHVAGMEFRVSSDNFKESFFSWTVPLFADPSFNLVQPGDWTTLSFSFASARVVGTPDRSAIDSVGWVVRDAPDPASGAPRPVVADWLGLEWVQEPAKGVVSFTFDDGYDEHFLHAAPELGRHGFKGTAYVIPDQVGRPGYMNTAQLRALRERYAWTLAAHHLTPFTDLGPRLSTELDGVDRFLRAYGTGDRARHVAYPLGKHDASHVLPMVRRRFDTARLASGGSETLPPGDAHRLRAFNVLSTTPPEEIGRLAERAHRNGEWLILMFHFLVDRPERETEYALEHFAEAVSAVARTGVAVRTVDEVWQALATDGSPGGAERPAKPASGAR